MVAQNDLRDFSSHSCRLPSNAVECSPRTDFNFCVYYGYYVLFMSNSFDFPCKKENHPKSERSHWPPRLFMWHAQMKSLLGFNQHNCSCWHQHIRFSGIEQHAYGTLNWIVLHFVGSFKGMTSKIGFVHAFCKETIY